MTVSSTTSRVTYSGNGVTTNFVVPFYFLANSELLVTRLNADGTETTMALTTNYTVTGAANPSGGSIDFVSGAPASGTTITITRNVPITQGVVLPATGLFPSATVSGAFDRLTMICQQLSEKLARSLQFPISFAGNPTLPYPLEAGKFLTVNPTGDGFVLSSGSTATDTAVAAAATATAAASQAAIYTKDIERYKRQARYVASITLV